MIRAALLALIGVGLIAAGSVLITQGDRVALGAGCLLGGAVLILGAARSDGGGRHR